MKQKTETVTRIGVGRKLPVKPAVLLPAVSFVITVILELLSRRSFTGLFRFITGNPVAFIVNWSVVALTYAIALLLKKKAFTLSLTTILWLTAGLVNNHLLTQRTGTPLSAGDLYLNLNSVLMMPVFYTWLQIILLALLVCAIIAGLVILFIKTPVYRHSRKNALLRLSVTALVLAGAVYFGISGGMISGTLKPSLYEAYQNYGFAYGFVYSFFDTGIQKPEEYSHDTVKQVAEDIDISIGADIHQEPAADRNFLDTFREYLRTGEFRQTPAGYTTESVDTIAELIGSTSDSDSDALPNFVFIQLEAFCDPLIFTNYTFDADPIPFFRSLYENCPGGKLSVPTVSGGTANTEFEVLTACNLDFFGSGDVPFNDVLTNSIHESLATDLKTLGYTSTFIHSYTGTFYNRSLVYSNLCFDRFVSLEYMNGYETTPKGWVKDSVFETYIPEALKSTSGRDYIHAVTVQTHSSYSDLPEGTEIKFHVESTDGEDAALAAAYYATQLNETDTFIKNLTGLLMDYPEPVVLVLYGDHLPGLTYDTDDITDGDMYATRYVIWANFPFDGESKNIEAYQLSARVLGMFSLDPGVMTRFHQTQSDTENYLQNMVVLEYDIMYGDHHVYKGAELSRTAPMQMGIYPVTMTGYYTSRGHLFVTGTNFTFDSRICINGNSRNTIFVNENLLISPDTVPEEGSSVTVSQISADGTVLSTAQ